MGRRKQFIGLVVSDKMQKTAVVRVTFTAKHPKYGRITSQDKKFKAHDEKKIAKIGDMVRIEETRPVSKDKFFRITEVIKKLESPKVELKEEVL